MAQVTANPKETKGSASQVIKIPAFEGSLPARPLYIYLPAGYEGGQHHYPVIYMHDGQNCFETFVHDSYAGSWQADKVADKLIAEKRMQACIIVAAGHGETERIAEYMPPYSIYRPESKGRWWKRERIQKRLQRLSKGLSKRRKPKVHVPKASTVRGVADKTFRYYRDELVPYIAKHYRILEGRDNTATVGSSMGGLFSTYIALEKPDFAKHHALMSPSYWITKNARGELEMLERLKHLPKRDVRLWLDSGEGSGGLPGSDDDNKFVTLEMKRTLLESGYEEGKEFRYYLAKGARHSESAWAARLPLVFEYLFPMVK